MCHDAVQRQTVAVPQGINKSIGWLVISTLTGSSNPLLSQGKLRSKHFNISWQPPWILFQIPSVGKARTSNISFFFFYWSKGKTYFAHLGERWLAPQKEIHDSTRSAAPAKNDETFRDQHFSPQLLTIQSRYFRLASYTSEERVMK